MAQYSESRSRFIRIGIEVRVKHMKNDGSRSWILINRGMNKCVEKLYEENEEFLHYWHGETRCDKPPGTNQIDRLSLVQDVHIN